MFNKYANNLTQDPENIITITTTLAKLFDKVFD